MLICFQVLKEDLIVSLEGMIEITSNLLKQLLQIDMAETLNLDTLMDAVSVALSSSLRVFSLSGPKALGFLQHN